MTYVFALLSRVARHFGTRLRTPPDAITRPPTACSGARGASRQALAQYVNGLLNTRIAGFHLVREPHGKWGASRYILRADDANSSVPGSDKATDSTATTEKPLGVIGVID